MPRPTLLARGWSRSLVAVGALTTGLLASESVSAQVTRDFDVERFTPAPDGDGFLTMPGTRTPGPWRWNVGFSLAYARDPLTVNTRPNGVISDRLDGNLYAQLGLGGTVAVVVQAPVVLYQSGAAGRIDGGPALMASAIRDARIALRWRLFGEDATVERDRHEGEGLALQIAGTIPIGQRGTFAGEALPQLEGAVLGDFHLLDIGIGGMLGFRHRFAEPMLFESRFRNELFGLIAIQVPVFVVDHVVAITEFDVTTDAENLFGNAGSTPAEWRLGLRVSAIRDVQITVMGGTALTSGVGAALARGIVQLSWAPRVHDRDHDGIVDDQDSCQTLPEDFDAHQDEDGCPEPDNDGDLVPDLDDACPNEAATFGTDLNDDGCNDPVVDTDQDGISDGADACPEEAEDRDGFEDENGCADADNDGDQVPDASDACPLEAEDRDGFEDDNGCPDPDNDIDGVPDASDACATEPEDGDGFEDEDGCAEIDNDRDGVLDTGDQCANEAETLNGVRDDDGCADRGGRSTWTPIPSATRGEGSPGWQGRVRWQNGALQEPLALRELAQRMLANEPSRASAQRFLLRLGTTSEAERASFVAALDAEILRVAGRSIPYAVESQPTRGLVWLLMRMPGRESTPTP